LQAEGETKNLGLLKAGTWEEEDSHEGSLSTSIYAAIEKAGSRNFRDPKAQSPPKQKLRVSLRHCFFPYAQVSEASSKSTKVV
jgi:hypothetical protein